MYTDDSSTLSDLPIDQEEESDTNEEGMTYTWV
jgi:hypothetical protein